MQYRTRAYYTDAQKALMWKRWKEGWTPARRTAPRAAARRATGSCAAAGERTATTMAERLLIAGRNVADASRLLPGVCAAGGRC